MTKKKHTNLQPWLDYFGMLRQYEQKGFLQVKPQEHEAYITRAALLTLAGIDEQAVQYTAAVPQSSAGAALSAATRQLQAIPALIRRLRTYAAYLSTEGEAYLAQPFALHIVKEDYPHDLLLTVLLQQRRTWYGRTKEHIEVIDYTEKEAEQ